MSFFYYGFPSGSSSGSSSPSPSPSPRPSVSSSSGGSQSVDSSPSGFRAGSFYPLSRSDSNSSIGSVAQGAMGNSDHPHALKGFMGWRITQAAGSFLMKSDPNKDAKRQFLQANLANSGALLTAIPQVCKWATHKLAKKFNLSSGYAQNCTQSHLESLLLTALVNIVTAIQKTQVPSLAPKPVTMIDVIAHVISIVKKHSAAIAVGMQQAELINDPELKEAQRKAIFADLTNEILNLAFPGGSRDLGLRAKGGNLWGVISDPANFLFLYNLFIGPQTDEIQKLDALKQTPSGKALSLLSTFLADQVATQAPQLSEANAKIIGEQASNILNIDISTLLSETIRDIARSNNQEISAVWTFLGHRVSAVFSKALYNIATDNGLNDLGNDPLSNLVAKLKPIFSTFFATHGARLKEEFAQVAANAQQNQKEEEEKVAADGLLPKSRWAQEVFGELAHDILEATNISAELPPLICKFGIDRTIYRELPGWLFSIYGELIKRHPNLIEWLNPKKSTGEAVTQLENASGNKVGSSFAKGIVRKALDILPKQCDDAVATQVADIVLDQIASKITVFAAAEPQTKTWIKAWLINVIKSVFTNDPDAIRFQQFIGDHLEGALATMLLQMATHNPNLANPQPVNPAPANLQAASNPANPQAVNPNLANLQAVPNLANPQPVNPAPVNPQAVPYPANPQAANPAPVTPKIGLAECASQFVLAAQNFANQNGNQIDAAITAFEGLPSTTDAERQAKSSAYANLIAMFVPLSNALVDLIGLDKVKKISVLGMDDKIKQELLPKFLFGLYKEMQLPKSGCPATNERLCRLLFDKDQYLKSNTKSVNIAYTILNKTPADLTQTQRDALWIDSGVNVMADETKRFTAIAADILSTSAQSFLKSYDVTKLLNDFFGLGLQPNSADAKLLNDEVQRLIAGNTPGSKEIWDYGQQMLEMALPKVLINIVESTEAAKRAAAGGAPPRPTTKHRLSKIPADFIVHISKALGNKLQGVDLEVKRIRGLPIDAKAKQDQLRAFFQPFVKEVLDMAGADIAVATHPLHDLPGSISLKKSVWENLIPTLLCDLMINYYDNIHQEIDPLQKQQRQIFGSNHVQSTSHVLAEFAKAYAPYFLATQSSQLTRAFKKWTDYLKAKNVDVVALIPGNIKEVGTNPNLAPGWDFVSSSIEPVILKFLGGISSNLDKMERNSAGAHNPEFLMDMAPHFMDRMNLHITTMNQITKARKKSHPHQVAPKDMLMDFRIKGQLHDALDDTNPQKREDWIKSLVNRLLILGDIDASAMPVPEPLKKEVFTLLQDELGPKIVKSLIDELSKSHTQNGIKIALIDNMQKVCDALMQLPPVGVVRMLTAAEQQKVDAFKAQAGGVLGQVVKSLPNTLINALQNVGQLKGMTDDALGTAIYEQLNVWPMTNIIKKLVESILPSMHPGTWSGDAFHPDDRTRANGVDALTPIAALKFSFPPSAQEQAWQAERVTQTAADFIQKANKLGNAGIDVTVKKMATNLWNKIEAGINAALKFIFRSHAAPVQRLVKEFLTFIGKIFGVIFYPIDRVIHLIQEKHVARQVQHLNKNINQPINENLMLQLVDLFIDNAKSRKQQMAAQALAAAAPPPPGAAPAVPVAPPAASTIPAALPAIPDGPD